jgi:hypothetical protein
LILYSKFGFEWHYVVFGLFKSLVVYHGSLCSHLLKYIQSTAKRQLYHLHGTCVGSQESRFPSTIKPKIGTNADDEDEEADGNGDASLPCFHSGNTHCKSLPKLSVWEYYCQKVEAAEAAHSQQQKLSPFTKYITGNKKTPLSILNPLQRKPGLAEERELHKEVCLQPAAVPPMNIVW